MDIPQKTELSRENLYTPTRYLGVGFSNELLKVALHPKGHVWHLGKVSTIEERFANAKGLEADSKVQEEIAAFPEKVLRINQIATLLNDEILDATTFKQAQNEMKRLLNGENASLDYPEAEANPDLLKL